MPEQEDAVPLEGSVERITFYNPESGFTVAKLRVRGRRDPVAVVGRLPAVQPGEILQLMGRWQTDRLHGAQFRPEHVSVRPPAALDDLVRYLGSGLIHQLGPLLARRIVDTFGTQTLEVLDSQPQRVREVPGIGPQRARALADAWVQHRALRAVSAFLSEHGIDTRFALRLVAAYGQAAPKVLSANPYRLVAEVPGLGFAAADHLGSDLGIRATSAVRLQAAVHAALLRATEQGHTRLTREALAAQAAELAGVDGELIQRSITQLLAGGVIAVTVAGTQRALGPLVVAGQAGARPLPPIAAPIPAPSQAGEAAHPIRSPRLRIYEPVVQEKAQPPEVSASDHVSGLGLSGFVRAEEVLAARLLELAARPGQLSATAVDAWLAADVDARALADEQRAAVRSAALSGCFVLTGGPGVGKTTTLRVLVRCLQSLERSVALAAPTGKAAKRLGEVVGLEAKTIHRLLGAGPKGFRYGSHERLPGDVVIVDEASMLDTQLARAVVSAVGRQAQLVLVGDADQLPSVGPGQVLRDLLQSGRVPSVRLETVFRQAARSQIVSNAHRIRRGMLPQLAPPAALGDGIDCVFAPTATERIPELTTDWAAVRLPKLLGVSAHEVQVLAPLTRVCQALNSTLQATLNPPRGQAERPHGALALRIGDRVIQTRNNYRLGVFNGDTAVITAVEPEEISLDFGDGRVVSYVPSDLLDLEHAYCLTVHRAQGSEWPGVVVLASSSYGPMLSRNLLYTALTRARRAAIIIGDEAAITRAVAETRDQNRSTGLEALLAAQAGAWDGGDSALSVAGDQEPPTDSTSGQAGPHGTAVRRRARGASRPAQSGQSGQSDQSGRADFKILEGGLR